MLARIAKAVAGGVTAFAGAHATALADGSVTAQEWASVIIAAIVAAVGVWLVPNAAAPTEESEQA